MADTNDRPSFSEGDATVRITWVDYQMSKGGNPMLAFKLEGTDGDSKGARTTHRIPLIGKMMWRFYNFCRAAGVNAKDAFLARKSPEDLLEIFVGKEVIATFESSKYKDKDGINRVGYDVATTKPVDPEAQAVAAFTAGDFPTGDSLVEITWVDLVESSTGKPMLNFKLVSSIGPKAGAEHTYRAVLTDSSVWKHDDLATAVGLVPAQAFATRHDPDALLQTWVGKKLKVIGKESTYEDRDGNERKGVDIVAIESLDPKIRERMELARKARMTGGTLDDAPATGGDNEIPF